MSISQTSNSPAAGRSQDVFFPNNGGRPIPEELVSNIAQYVDPRVLSEISRDWKRMANDLWQHEFYSMMNIGKETINEQPLEDYVTHWKKRLSSRKIAVRIGERTEEVTVGHVFGNIKNRIPVEEGNDEAKEAAKAQNEEILRENNMAYKKLALVEFHEQEQRYARVKEFWSRVDGGQGRIEGSNTELLSAKNAPLSNQYKLMHDLTNIEEIPQGQFENVLSSYLDSNTTQGLQFLEDLGVEKILNKINSNGLLGKIFVEAIIYSKEHGVCEACEYIIKTIWSNQDLMNRIPNDGVGLGNALSSAALSGQREIVRAFFTNQAVMNRIPNDGVWGLGNALSSAALSGQREIVRAFFTNQAVMNRIPNDGHWSLGVALRKAALSGQREIVEAFFTNQAVMNRIPNDGEYGFGDALCQAARNGHREIVQMFFTNESVMNRIPNVGEYGLGDALGRVARNGHREIVQMFFTNESVMNRIPNVGEYGLGDALGRVARNGHREIVQMFFTNESVMKRIPNDGFRGLGGALHIAVYNGHREILEAFFSNEVVMARIPNDGQWGLGVALRKAVYNGHREVVEAFFSNEAVMNRIPNDGQGGLGEALRIAVYNGHVDIVKELLSHENLADRIPVENLVRVLSVRASPRYAEIVNEIFSHKNLVDKIQDTRFLGLGKVYRTSSEWCKSWFKK